MRGRGGRSSSSSVTQEQSRMALRKQPIRNASSESQCLDEDTQEVEAAAERDIGEELSSLRLTTRRERRWREKENKSKPKEMTEEDMMDLALRLSEQEASVTALRQQQEEEAMIKAIQESMGGETQSSQTLLTDTSLRLCSRRKLSYPNGNKPSAVDDEASKDDCMSETNHKTGAEGAGEGNPKRSKKQKRRAASPLQEMPDLSQTQEISSQISPSRSESSSVCLDSPQSSDSTLVEDSQLQKSPVFPLTGCRAAVQVDRLNQDLVETCRNSGFVLCSQNSWTWTQKSAQPKSPTFPQSDLPSRPKSPISIDVDQEGDREAELSPQFVKSPVFSSNTQQEQRFPSAYKHQNAQFIFSSQETLSPSIQTGSSCSDSPVFPKSPGPSNKLPLSDQLGFSVSPARGQRDPSQDRSTSPVFIQTAAQQRIHTEGPSDDRKDTKSDGLNTVMYLPESEELKEKSRDCNSDETELTSDEDDVVPVGFPSPVFPAERPIHQAASQNHLTTASPGPTRLQQSLNRQTPLLGKFGDQSSSDKLAPPGTSSSSKFTSRRQHRELTREAAGSVSPPPVEPSRGQIVRYYWGVPFCPRGLDPDTYTQVIMTQMEVYEKSLKQAQRCLLRKAEWGEAVLPQPEKSPSPEVPAGSPQHHIPRRRGLRLRGRKTKEVADSFPAEAKEVEDREDEEELQHEKEDEKNEGDEEQMNTDDCEVCPETQLSNNNSPQDLMMESETEAEISLLPPTTSSELPEIEMILREESPAGEDTQEEETDASVDERMEINVAGCSADSGGRNEEEKDRRGPDVEEVKDGGPQRSTSPELEPAVVPESPKASIDCPICQASFPASEIEMHAAYCDGEVAVVDERRPESNRFQESLKPRRKRWRRAEGTAAETNQPSNTSRNQEKCYICQKNVPLRDYNRHTELCIQRRAPRSVARGNLLSALEQTESRNSDARPSGSRVQPEDVIDLRDDDDDDDEEEATSAFRISNSPIRSFTPISEATDCLIDFKKHQQAKKPSQRRRRR